MTLRPRRNLVLWSQTARSAGRTRTAPVARGRRIRRSIRRGGRLILIGLMALGRAGLARWGPLLAGVVLTVFGVILHGGARSTFLLPGLMLLISAPLLPGRSRARTKLERDLAAYSTPAARRDLQATLDQYPDDTTRELRKILASQAMADDRKQTPAFGRR
ncbi:MAG: hypothetical protein ACRDOU_33470 [Streptosporangiaceae bacterium]